MGKNLKLNKLLGVKIRPVNAKASEYGFTGH